MPEQFVELATPGPRSVVSACTAPATLAAMRGVLAAGPGFVAISESALDALIKRIEEAIAFNLALGADDYRLLINALGTRSKIRESGV